MQFKYRGGGSRGSSNIDMYHAVHKKELNQHPIGKSHSEL